jgi:hypothetical protein
VEVPADKGMGLEVKKHENVRGGFTQPTQAGARQFFDDIEVNERGPLYTRFVIILDFRILDLETLFAPQIDCVHAVLNHFTENHRILFDRKSRKVSWPPF